MDIQIMKRQGLSQRQIARKLGISRNTVKKYLDEPTLAINKQSVFSRKSHLDPYRGNIEAWLMEDMEYKATWIRISLDPCAYVGTSELQSYTVTASGLSGKTVIYKTANLIDDFIVVSDGFVVAEYLGAAIYHINKSGVKSQPPAKPEA